MAATNFCQSCSSMNPISLYRPAQNCDAAAKFLVPWVDKKTIDMQHLAEYVRSFGGSNVQDVDAIMWFFCARDCDNAEMNEELIEKPILQCKDEMCAAWEWAGNADIVGIGMMVVYTFGSILATVYVWSFLKGMREDSNYTSFKKPGVPSEQGFLNKLRSTFYHSLGVFHSGLGLLTVSVQLASLVICGRNESLYDINMSFLASAVLATSFSLTLPIYMDTERKMWPGLTLGCIVWLLFIILVPFSATASAAAGSAGHVRFEAHCWDATSFDGVVLAVRLLFIFAFTIVLVVAFGRAVAHCSRKPVDSLPGLGWLIRQPWRLFWTSYFIIYMWVSLICLFQLRSAIASKNGGHVSDMESNWAFGQILALATWAPVLEETIVILCNKGSYANEQRMNRHFVAVEERQEPGEEASQPCL